MRSQTIPCVFDSERQISSGMIWGRGYTDDRIRWRSLADLGIHQNPRNQKNINNKR